MSIRKRPVLVVLAVMALALAGGGAAFAVTKSHAKSQNRSQAQSGTTQQKDCPHGAFGRGPGGPGFFDAAASYLGLTNQELFSRLQNGQSLADVAKAQGKSVSGLEDAIVNDASSKLQKAVDAGRLTESQKNEILSNLRSHVADIVNGNLPKMGSGGPPGGFGAGPPMGVPPMGNAPWRNGNNNGSNGSSSNATYGPPAAGPWA
jgi:hypothetical protein